MQTIHEHRIPQESDISVHTPQPPYDPRREAIRQAQELVQPFLAARAFVQKHPDFDLDALVTKWRRVRNAVSRFGHRFGTELRIINGAPLTPEDCHLAPDTQQQTEHSRVLVAQFVTAMAGYAEDVLAYVRTDPGGFSPTVAMTKYSMLVLAIDRYDIPLEMAVADLCPGRNPLG